MRAKQEKGQPYRWSIQDIKKQKWAQEKKKKRKRERGKEKKYWGFCISVHLAQIHSSHPVQGQVTSSATSKLSNPQLSKKKFKWVDQLPYL